MQKSCLISRKLYYKKVSDTVEREESVKSIRDWGEGKRSLKKVLSRRVAMQPKLVVMVLAWLGAPWEEWAGQRTWS